jgi:NADH-quinone oxidoreductase subunit J
VRLACAVAVFGFLGVCSLGGGTALAQTAPPSAAPAPPDRAVVAPQPLVRAGAATKTGGAGQAVLFWIFALITVGGAIAMVTRRNAVTAVMFLVGAFLGLSGLYVLLYAHFLAVIQVLVYAGAVMVLFVFVVMILNKEEEEPWALRGVVGKALAGAALAYYLIRLITVLVNAPRLNPEVAAPLPVSYGTTQAMAEVLFSGYLFPFEAVSLILLVAVVGALVLAHPAHPNVGEEELE